MTETNSLPLPLRGLRVLDATHIVAGPFCSLILADMGAEVIKIERPKSGDLVRGRGPFVRNDEGEQVSSRYLGINRNKKSVTLDLRHPKCKEVFENLVRQSDILIDNWGPGAFERLGLGYEYLHKINPRLIYASITGYGDAGDRKGPYSSWPANNLSIQSMSGWMEITGDADGPPQSVGDNVGDSVPGVWTALGIMMALESRNKTGVGQLVDMAMYDCMVSHVVSNMNAYQATKTNPGRSRARLVSAGMPFKAKDGYVVMAGVRSEQRLRSMWEMIGRLDLAEDPEYLGHNPDGEFYFNYVIPAIEKWSETLPKWEVAAKLTEIGFSMGVAQTVSDLAECEHLTARNMFIQTDDTLGGKFTSLRTPIWLTECDEVDHNTPPTLGEHNYDILTTLGGLNIEELASLKESGHV
ncbi:MAG: CaiB/BaiF CoA-transferase family protein [Chloroflexota bacterium]|nr:CaiB/BaiF CoA-transferase family protein [Chloroflexota bacterium]